MAGLASREFAWFSWGTGELPHPDWAAVHGTVHGMCATSSLSARDSDFPLLSGGKLHPFSGVCSLPTNSRPPAFPSLTQCQPEDLKFCPCCLFLILGSGPSFPFPSLTLAWLWNHSWDGRFAWKAPGEQGPAAETCDSHAAPWLHGPPLPPCCFFLLLCHLATFSPFLAF